ncbi:MAG: ribonuclease D [Longimicrobiales bacterium]
MTVTFVQDPEGAKELQDELSGVDSVAVDCEAAGFHRYSDRLCLVQLSTESRTFVLDPLATNISTVLKPTLEDPGVIVLMHGAAYDLRLLQRDLGIFVTRLSDTQVAASLLGEPSVSLQALLQRHLDVKVSKKYQRADWAQRPLTDEMLDYAAGDTRHLHRLANILAGLLDEAGRQEWAMEEYVRLVESARAPESKKEPVDPVTRVKGARSLDPIACTALRAGLAWRDTIARKKDRAPFRVISDQALMEAAQTRPRTVSDFGAMKGVSERLIASHGQDLIGRYEAIEGMEPEELEPYPSAPPRSSRPSPEVEALFESLKAERNQIAQELGIERGRLMSNSLLLEIAMAGPTDLEELLAVADVRKWQVDLFGDQLLNALRTKAGGSAAKATP